MSARPETPRSARRNVEEVRGRTGASGGYARVRLLLGGVMYRIRTVRPATAIALVTLAVALGRAAFATIPDSGGTVHTCYHQSNGALRVVESDADCRTNETPLGLSAAGQGGAAIVARARSAGPVPVTALTVPIPLTDNTWTQGASDTNELFIETTIS